jgi:hypothetical protein
MLLLLSPNRNDARNVHRNHPIFIERLRQHCTSPIQVFLIFQACFDYDNRHLLRTQDLVKQDPVCSSILFDPPSHAIYEKADAVEAPDKRIELVDCLPMGNTALLSLVKPNSVVNREVVISKGCFVALVFESAPNRTVGHLGDILAYDHVHDRTFARTRLAEEDYIMLNDMG